MKKMKNARFGSRHGKVEEILNVHKLLTHHVIYTLVWLTCAAVLGGIIFRMARYLWSRKKKISRSGKYASGERDYLL